MNTNETKKTVRNCDRFATWIEAAREYSAPYGWDKDIGGKPDNGRGFLEWLFAPVVEIKSGNFVDPDGAKTERLAAVGE